MAYNQEVAQVNDRVGRLAARLAAAVALGAPVIGISIDGRARVRIGEPEGVGKKIVVVEGVPDLRSADVVTRPSAGGGFLNVREAEMLEAGLHRGSWMVRSAVRQRRRPVARGARQAPRRFAVDTARVGRVAPDGFARDQAAEAQAGGTTRRAHRLAQERSRSVKTR